MLWHGDVANSSPSIATGLHWSTFVVRCGILYWGFGAVRPHQDNMTDSVSVFFKLDLVSRFGLSVRAGRQGQLILIFV